MREIISMIMEPVYMPKIIAGLLGIFGAIGMVLLYDLIRRGLEASREEKEHWANKYMRR